MPTQLRVSVCAAVPEAWPQVDELGWTMLQALVSEVRTEVEDGVGTLILIDELPPAERAEPLSVRPRGVPRPPPRAAQRWDRFRRVLPRVRVREPAGHGPQREAVRSQSPVFELAPVQRRSHRRAALGPHRVRRDDQLRVDVAGDVEVEPSTALGLAELVRVALRLPRAQHVADRAGELVHLLRLVPPDRSGRSRAARAEPLVFDLARQLELVEQGAQRERRVPCLIELAARRIEVEHHLVGAPRPIGLGQPACRVTAVWLDR